MRVFLLDISSIDEKKLKRLAATLPPFRRAAAKGCHKAHYPQNVLGFCLVRYAIRALDPTADTESWIIGEGGKPRLAAGMPFFNLAHTTNAVAVAVSENMEVGVDIEEIKPRLEGFAARFFSEEEQRAVDAAPDPTSELIRIWSAKEAEAKRSGAGLAKGIRSIPNDRVRSVLVTVGNAPHWLSVSPADSFPPLVWISLEQLQ